jgi:hypothetical protein
MVDSSVSDDLVHPRHLDGYAQPTEDELQRLHESLEHMIRAKAAIRQAAASVGWPLGGAG